MAFSTDTVFQDKTLFETRALDTLCTQTYYEGGWFGATPIKPITHQDTSATFIIPSSQGCNRFDFGSKHGYLMVKCKIVKSDGSAIVDNTDTAFKKIAPGQFVSGSLFRNISTYLNDTPVGNGDSYLYFSNFISYVLSTSKEYKHTIGTLGGWINEYSIKNGAESEGLEKSRLIWHNSNEVCLLMPLWGVLPKFKGYMPSGVTTKLTYTFTDQKFFIFGDSTRMRFDITAMSIHIPTLVLNPTRSLYEYEKSQKTDFQFDFDEAVLTWDNIPAAKTQIMLTNICPQKSPKMIILCFVTSDSFQGTSDSFLYDFKPFNLNEARISQGVNVQHYGPGMQDSKHGYLRAYRDFIMKCSLDRHDIGISINDYNSDRFFMVFDLTTSWTATSNIWHLKNHTPIDLFLSWNEEIPAKGIVALKYCIYEKLITIDSNKAVSIM